MSNRVLTFGHGTFYLFILIHGNLFYSVFKFGSVEFPLINLLIEGSSTEAKYIMSHPDSVIRRGCLKGRVYLRGPKSVYLRVLKKVLEKMSSSKSLQPS